MGLDGAEDERRWRLDGVVVGVLALAAAVVRWGARPTDGLWHDDTWVVAGARAGLDDLLVVSTNHPGFTLPYAVWGHLGPMATDHVALPVLALGVLTPPALHLLLRRLGVATAVAGGTAALLVSSSIHAQYSGRVKPYVVEALLVVVLAAVIHVLARRPWTRRTALAWVAGAVALGTLSAFALVITGVAGVVLAATPCGDGRRRLAAVVAQASIQVPVGLFLRSRYDASTVGEDWERMYDGYIELTANPVRLLGDVLAHAGRVGGALVGTSGAVGVIVVATAVAGLALATRHPTRGPVARFLLGLLTVALVGGMVEQIPFGPTIANVVFPGSRATIWLLPALVVGIALALDAASHRVPPVPARAIGAAAVLGGVALFALRFEDRPPHGALGTETAVALIREEREPEDVVIVLAAGALSHVSEPGTAVAAVPDTGSRVGYRIRSLDTATVVLPPQWGGDPEVVADLIGGAPSVFVHNTAVGLGDGPITQLATVLTELGYRPVARTTIEINEVQRWERDPGG